MNARLGWILALLQWNILVIFVTWCPCPSDAYANESFAMRPPFCCCCCSYMNIFAFLFPELQHSWACHSVLISFCRFLKGWSRIRKTPPWPWTQSFTSGCPPASHALQPCVSWLCTGYAPTWVIVCTKRFLCFLCHPGLRTQFFWLTC